MIPIQPFLFFVGYPILEKLVDATALGLTLKHFPIHDQSNEKLFTNAGADIRRPSGNTTYDLTNRSEEFDWSDRDTASEYSESLMMAQTESSGNGSGSGSGEIGCPFQTQARASFPRNSHANSARKQSNPSFGQPNFQTPRTPRSSTIPPLSRLVLKDSFEGFDAAMSMLEVIHKVSNDRSFDDFLMSLLEVYRQCSRLGDFLFVTLDREKEACKGNSSMMFREDSLSTAILVAYVRNGG